MPSQPYLCWLLALGPVLPDHFSCLNTEGLTRVKPAHTMPASGVSGVNEAIAGHSSLGFGSCPRLTVEITICRTVAQLCSNLFWISGSPYTPPGLFRWFLN